MDNSLLARMAQVGYCAIASKGGAGKGLSNRVWIIGYLCHIFVGLNDHGNWSSVRDIAGFNYGG
jgi:hypothetical protein